MNRREVDRPEYGSYEEVHEQLVAAMQEACMNDTSREYDTPVLDMSFLYEESERKTNSKFRLSRLSAVMAIVIVMLLSLNAVLLISDANEAYSEKGLLHRIHEGVRGIFTDEDPSQFVEVDETGEVFIITDMKDIDKAKAFWPELCVPGYLPDGYELVELEITKSVSNEYRAMYKFNNELYDLNICAVRYSYADKHLSNNKGYMVYRNDRTINIYYDQMYKRNVTDVYFDDLVISIQGQISNEELLELSSGLE